MDRGLGRWALDTRGYYLHRGWNGQASVHVSPWVAVVTAVCGAVLLCGVPAALASEVDGTVWDATPLCSASEEAGWVRVLDAAQYGGPWDCQPRQYSNSERCPSEYSGGWAPNAAAVGVPFVKLAARWVDGFVTNSGQQAEPFVWQRSRWPSMTTDYWAFELRRNQHTVVVQTRGSNMLPDGALGLSCEKPATPTGDIVCPVDHLVFAAQDKLVPTWREARTATRGRRDNLGTLHLELWGLPAAAAHAQSTSPSGSGLADELVAIDPVEGEVALRGPLPPQPSNTRVWLDMGWQTTSHIVSNGVLDRANKQLRFGTQGQPPELRTDVRVANGVRKTFDYIRLRKNQGLRALGDGHSVTSSSFTCSSVTRKWRMDSYAPFQSHRITSSRECCPDSLFALLTRHCIIPHTFTPTQAT